ncbi:septal ring lytic transglycosylase RlpA family protein [Luteimonas pelagia]
MRHLALPALAVLMAACSGAPKKSDPPPPAETARAPATRPAPPRRSPYPPAQEDPSKRGDYVAGGLYAPGVKDSAPSELPEVDLIPEPEVVDEPRSRYGNRSPYTVLGRSYRVMDDTRGYSEEGRASYYGRKFHGRRTSNLEVYDMYAFTAAHKTLPLPSFARVTNLDNGRSVIVRVNDRGPFHEGRVIDLSWAAAVKLDMHQAGTARVRVEALAPGAEGAFATAPPPATATPHAPTAMDALVAELPEGGVATPAAEAEQAWRFEMQRDGQVRAADAFDAWMAERGARVATGRPAAPTAARRGTQAPSAATVAATETVTLVQPAAPLPAAGRGGVGTPSVQLQVASFAARGNADRVLAQLRGAGIEQARVESGTSSGRPVWRVRIGPVAEAAIASLAERVAGLGLGTPHVVRGQ